MFGCDPAAPLSSVERARLREAFLMHYVEGVPYETMAELLGASVSALKMRVLRAREALVSALQHDQVTQAVPIRLSTGGR